MKFASALVCWFASVVFLLSSLVYQFSHPALTQTQLATDPDFLMRLIPGCVLLLVGGIFEEANEDDV